MPLKFTLEKIRFATDKATFDRAVNIYKRGKIRNFKEGIGSYSAQVEGSGSRTYRVSVEARAYGLGFCNCYMGEKNYLCKHIVAVSLYAVKNGKPLTNQDTAVNEIPRCSRMRGTLSKTELAKVKKSITQAMRYIKPYHGPSRTWFAYQNSLSEGCRRLSTIVSKLPISCQTADVLVKLLLRLDKKLAYGGVDDSDGAVGGFIEEVVNVLKEYYELDKECRSAIENLKDQETSFGWEEPLIKIL